jgi:uroporphyrinogen decarboxylase
MTGKERVRSIIEGKPVDRMPIYGWVRANLEEEITAEFGSVEAFEDRYEFDLHHSFGGPAHFKKDVLDSLREKKGGDLEPTDLLDVDYFSDPDDESGYADLKKDLKFHGRDRGRFVYIQTPGIFESNNGLYGIENHLAYLLLYKDELKELYRRQAEWNRSFALHCLDLGVDMVHVSDDWGSQKAPLFSPADWREMIYPFHKITCDAVLARNGRLSVHSDGDVTALLDGIVDLGYRVVHPYQESAGMSYELYTSRYRDKFVIMGGLDVQTTIGFGKIDRLRAEIRRVMELFHDGGLIFCTTHYVQDHCTMEELAAAFDLAYELARV